MDNFLWGMLVITMILIITRIIYMVYLKVKLCYKRYKENRERMKEELEKKNFATPKKKARLKRKKNVNKKKALRIGIMETIKSYCNSYKMLSVTMLIILVILGFMIINDKSIIVFKNDIIEKNVKGIISVILLIVINSSLVVTISKSNDVLIKMVSIWPIIIQILAIGIVAIQSSMLDKTEAESRVIFSVCTLMVFIYILYVIGVKWTNSWISNMLVTLIYIFILVIGGVSFGMYYLNVFPEQYQNEIQIFNECIGNDTIRSTVIAIKVGIRTFYQFPAEEIYCKVALFQFLLGKVADMMFLGTLISRFRDLGKSA